MSNKQPDLMRGETFMSVKLPVLFFQTGIKVGSCVGSDGLTCLHVACQGGHADVVEQLLPHLDEVDVVDIRGQTAAHTAALNGELTCLKALHDRGSSTDECCCRASFGSPKLIPLLFCVIRSCVLRSYVW